LTDTDIEVFVRVFEPSDNCVDRKLASLLAVATCATSADAVGKEPTLADGFGTPAGTTKLEFTILASSFTILLDVLHGD